MNNKPHFNAFLNGLYPIEILQQRQNIISNLLSYVLEGTRDPHVSLLPTKALILENAVNSTMFLRSKQHTILTKGQQAKVPTGDTFEMVLLAFKNTIQRNNVNALSIPAFNDDKLSAVFGERFNASPDNWNDVDPSVQAAFNLAKINFTRAQTRITSLSVIRTLLMRNEYNTVTLDGFNEIRDILYLRASDFIKNVMLFGGLADNESAKEALKLACHHMVYDPSMNIDYSTIEYLSCDGIRPQGWASLTDEKFRTDIRKAYHKL